MRPNTTFLAACSLAVTLATPTLAQPGNAAQAAADSRTIRSAPS